MLYRYRAGIPWRDLPERFGDMRDGLRLDLMDNPLQKPPLAVAARGDKSPVRVVFNGLRVQIARTKVFRG